MKKDEIYSQIGINNHKIQFYEIKGAKIGGTTRLDKRLTELAIDTALLYMSLDQNEIMEMIGKNKSGLYKKLN